MFPREGLLPCDVGYHDWVLKPIRKCLSLSGCIKDKISYVIQSVIRTGMSLMHSRHTQCVFPPLRRA